MAILKRKKTGHTISAPVTDKLMAASFQDIDPISAATLSSSTLASSAYNAYGNVIMGGGAVGTVTSLPPINPVKTKEEQEEEILEISSTIENIIADYLPDSEDKELPVNIAKAVVTYLYKSGYKEILPSPEGSTMYSVAMDNVADRIKAMTMEEYAKVRGQLLGKHA